MFYTTICLVFFDNSDEKSLPLFILGLLAGMWEFPSSLLNENKSTQGLKDQLMAYGVDVPCARERNHIGEVSLN